MIQAYLSKIILQNRVPHSLLFSGPKGSGKAECAKNFAKQLLKTEKENHPDIHYYKPEGKVGLHPIQSMRELSEAVYIAPFEAEKKVFIIFDADRMQPAAANALLKTFEEPSLDSVIILISDAKEKILPTILSRCQIVRFQLSASGKIEQDESAFLSLRKTLLDAFASGQISFYPFAADLAKNLATQIEVALEAEEELFRQESMKKFSDSPTAQQRVLIEKEGEGVASLKKQLAASFLFNQILSWHRDLQLIHVSGDLAYLIHKDYQEALIAAYGRKLQLPVERVEGAIAEAMLALERSTSLQLCIENLFLKLDGLGLG